MPSILIQDLTPRNQYTATMGQTIFVYSFTLFAESDIEVYKRTSAATPADDNTQKLQLNIDYTVDLVASTVTLLVACSGGEIITLVRNMPDERLNLYTNGTVITADALNTDQESSVLLIQQNSLYDTVLAPHYNKSEIVDDANPLGGDTILPRLTANEVWVKDPTNNFITTAPFGGGGGGGVVPAVPGVTGNPNSIAVWSNIGILGDSNVLMTSGNITNLISISFQDLRIATVNSHTINSVNGKDLTLLADTGHNVNLATSGQQVTLSGLNYPIADGTAGYFLTTDGAGTLSWASGGGGAPFASTKYNLVQFSNTTGGLQDSGIDYQGGVLSGPSEVQAGNLSISGNTLASTDTNGNLNYTPNGSGVNVFTNNLEIKAGAALQFYRTSNAFYTAFKAGSPGANVTWTLPDADGSNGEVLTTDGAGTLSFASAGGGGIVSNIVQTRYTTAFSVGTNVDLPFGVTITPSSNTNRVRISFTGGFVGASNVFKLKRNGVILTVGSPFVGIRNAGSNFSFTYIDTPATTSAVTYTFIQTQSSTTVSYAGDATSSVLSLIAEEVGA